MSNPHKLETRTLHPRPGDVAFDLDRALAAVLSVRTRVPADATTATLLGTEREGHGVLIRTDGLVLTIGYLVAEADTVWLIDHRGKAVPGHVVGYDQESGFGLVQALAVLAGPPLPLGSSATLQLNETVIVAGYGGREQAIQSQIVAKQEFAGYWEYILDEALFTAPAHPNWGGAALIGADGTLRGIGSLLLHTDDEFEDDANMIVPIDLLPPILDDLLRYGRTTRPPRPWLGLFATEVNGRLVIADVIRNGPAARAGLRAGDVIVHAAGEPVQELARLFRRIWSLGTAGVDVPLAVLRDGAARTINIRSANRYDCLKAPHLH